MGYGGPMGRLVRPRTLAWSFPVLSAALVVVTVLVAVQASALRADAEISTTVPLVVLPLVFPTVGVLIARRNPSNPVGWLFCIVGAAGGALLTAGAVAVAEPALPGRDWAAWSTEWLYAVVLGALALVLLYFPNGRLPSRRWRVVNWLLAFALLVLVASVTFGTSLPTSPEVGSPVGIALPRQLTDAGFLLGWLLVWAAVVAAVASLLVRFTRVQGVQRQQLKWLTLATCLLAVLGVLAVVADLLGFRQLRENLAILFGVGLLAIPVTVGIAILRHRLYDIDLLINRTLIYGLVTVTLGLAYAGIALLLGALFGGRSSFTAATATLVVAAAFQPVRRRIQDTVDRSFNRHKYDAAQTIAAFSARLGRQVNLGALTDELAAVVRQTMQPTSFSLWLQPLGPDAEPSGIQIPPGDPLPVHVRELGRAVDLGSLRLDSAALRQLRSAGTELVVPLISQGELIGLLNLGPRRGERSYSADDRALLGDLAGQAAPALRLTQLVRRREEEVRERERIDRELHVAQLIQQRFLPHEPPELSGWHVAAYYGPARAAGGISTISSRCPTARWASWSAT
jgi:GAF domain-containing protein